MSHIYEYIIMYIIYIYIKNMKLGGRCDRKGKLDKDIVGNIMNTH